jgi:hypothetical protein
MRPQGVEVEQEVELMIRVTGTTRRRFRLSLVHLTILVYAGLTVFFVLVAQAEPGLQSDLTAITGQGAGHVSVSPTARDRGEIFHAQVTADVHDARPNTTFTVTRFVDQPPNGICTEAGGGLTLGTFTTSEGGAGAFHVERVSPGETPGFQFDLDFHVVGSDGTLLKSGCMTVTQK